MGVNDKYKGKSDSCNDSKEQVDRVRSLAGRNRAAALGLAVFLTLSTGLTGCAARNDDEDDDDTYYTSTGSSAGGYYHGGSYFYTRGGSYKSGSWGKSYISSAKSGGYSSIRGGSVTG